MPSPLLRAFAQLPEFFQVVSNLENTTPFKDKTRSFGPLLFRIDHIDCLARSFTPPCFKAQLI